MGKFNDVLDTFGEATEGAYTLPEDIVANLVSAYDEDIAVPAAELEAAQAANAELNTQIAALKELNSMLLAGVAASSGESSESDSEESDPEDITIDDLFE